MVRDDDIEQVQDAGLEKELSRYTSDLSSNKDVMGLVKAMQPLDIATCIQSSFGVVPKQALVITLNLLKNAKLSELTVQGTVMNQYPLPISRKKEDNENEVPNINKEYIAGPEPIKASEFPPAPRSNAQKWPYDPNTLFITDPKVKGKRRPLMQGYEPVAKTKKNQGGLPGPGTFQQLIKLGNNTNSSPEGGSSWDIKGTPGWSSTLSNKEFDPPSEEIAQYFPIKRKGVK